MGFRFCNEHSTVRPHLGAWLLLCSNVGHLRPAYGRVVFLLSRLSSPLAQPSSLGTTADMLDMFASIRPPSYGVLSVSSYRGRFLPTLLLIITAAPVSRILWSSLPNKLMRKPKATDVQPIFESCWEQCEGLWVVSIWWLSVPRSKSRVGSIQITGRELDVSRVLPVEKVF
jgi:hypothetical protein